MKKILFITWDGPQTTYMEALFMPIFERISKTTSVEFHVLQFTWADANRRLEIKKASENMKIIYNALPICRKPTVSIGSILTTKTSIKKISNYINTHQIDIVMPRSTIPALMINKVIKISKKNHRFKILFDADGLPIEEKVDFAGLKKNSYKYRVMKSAETQMLKNADAIICRTNKAINIHLQTIGTGYRSKFDIVINGRDTEEFSPKTAYRKASRRELGISDETVFVYAGSLGHQYCFTQMIEIFRSYEITHPSKFLILTGNLEYAKCRIPDWLKSKIILRNVSANKVSFYLNAGDIAFALRRPTFSMQGVAPIKIGEYLLCGLPVIASKEIGDSEEILKKFNEVYLYDHKTKSNKDLCHIIEFIEDTKKFDRYNTHQKATKYFSIESSAKSYIDILSRL